MRKIRHPLQRPRGTIEVSADGAMRIPPQPIELPDVDNEDCHIYTAGDSEKLLLYQMLSHETNWQARRPAVLSIHMFLDVVFKLIGKQHITVVSQKLLGPACEVTPAASHTPYLIHTCYNPSPQSFIVLRQSSILLILCLMWCCYLTQRISAVGGGQARDIVNTGAAEKELYCQKHIATVLRISRYTLTSCQRQY